MRHDHLLVRSAIALLTGLCLTGAQAGSRVWSFGVGTHLAQGESASETQRLLLRLGPAEPGLRDEAYWSDIERVPGELRESRNFEKLRQVMCDSPRAGASVLVLGYGNPAYDDGGRPTSDAAIAAYTRYARFVVSRCPNVGFVEVWNEWNLTTGAGMKRAGPGTPEAYFRLHVAVARALREDGYRGRILAGAVGGDRPDWRFTRRLLELGIGAYADGYSIHLYNFALRSKGGIGEFRTRVTALDQLLSASRDASQLPIYVTEYGWPTGGSDIELAPAAAARELLDTSLMLMSMPRVAGAWIYELLDRGDRAAGVESNFGLFRRDGSGKPTHCVARWLGTLASQRAEVRALGAPAGSGYLIRTGDRTTTIVLDPTAAEDGARRRALDAITTCDN
ncbi:hypothetical protein [Derxia gummosa]|uniref:Uncharacterized protein n=1 Tax=Derxia gummosa DSM 723 TaxID=1121388 RepID=A0A8B6X4N4_9BURK|nr:hypothetical protein [Derxia gummosa]